MGEAGKRVIHMPRFHDVFDEPKVKAVRAVTTFRSEIILGGLDEIYGAQKLEAWKAVLLAADRLSHRFTIKTMEAKLKMQQRLVGSGIRRLLKNGLIAKDASTNPPEYSITEPGKKLATQLLITMTILKRLPNTREIRTANKNVVKFQLRRGAYLLFFPPNYIEVHAQDRTEVREVLVAFRDELFERGLIK